MGVARARNAGAIAAEGDILVFLDAHCVTPVGWMGELVAPFDSPRVGLVGPALGSTTSSNGRLGYGVTWDDPGLQMPWLPRLADRPYPVPLLCGGLPGDPPTRFLAFRGLGSGMSRWGSEDHELSIRMWLLGYSVVVHPTVPVHHLFREHAYRVESSGVLFNLLRMAFLHLRMERVQRVIDYYDAKPELAAALHQVLGSDALARRAQLDHVRRRTDDWWFSTFGVWPDIPLPA